MSGRPDGIDELRLPDSASAATIDCDSGQKAISSDEQFHLQLLDSVQESVIATDLQGSITYWGQGAQRMFGYTVAEAMGQSISIVALPTEKHAALERMQHVIHSGTWKGDCQQRRKDGAVFWTSAVISLVKDDVGKPIGFVGIDIDITDRKRANEEIDQLNLAIENAMQGISRLDRQGRFTMVKPMYARMLGYESHELIGQSWEVTVPERDQPLAQEGYETMLRDGSASLECQALRKDGSVFCKQLLLVKTFDERGEIDGHYCFMSDVTKRKQAEEELLKKESQLAHVSRLSTMGEMVAGIAHEINQPLYAIANFATVAEKKLEHPQNERESTLLDLNKQIATQALRAGNIIRRLQVFVRKSDVAPIVLDINPVIREAAAILAPMVRSSNSLVSIELVDHPVLVRADRVQLEQVLVNLVRNALESVANSICREITIRTSVDDNTALISVLDSGVGIPAEVAEDLFDAFYTTKKNGMGMGLAISRTIVESHHGRIWIEPRDQGGVGVHFTMPLVEAS